MTILEAFRNRGLLVHERSDPVYKVRYSYNDLNGYFLVCAKQPETARKELQEAWESYAEWKRLPGDCIKEISCIGNRYEGIKEEGM